MDATGMKARVKDRLQRAGWDINRFPYAKDAPPRRARLLTAKGVDLVVDVGANIGQYGLELRRWGYAGDILSLEPMGAAYEGLSATAEADGRWTAIRSAAGAEAGKLTINIAGNSVSSSALPMLQRHSDASPHSVYVTTETAPVDRLDKLLADRLTTYRRPYLKIDTQGFESHVLDGAAGVLDRFVGVELELSLVPLYEGQTLMPDMLERMAKAGLRLAMLTEGFFDQGTGETLQMDGVFLRD